MRVTLRLTPASNSVSTTRLARPPTTTWFSAVTTWSTPPAKFGHRLGVERLDRRHVQHGDGDAALRQRVRGVERPLGHEAGGDDADILAVAQLPRLADLEAVAGIEHDRHGAAQQPHVDRAGMVGDRHGRRLDLGGVAGIDDGEPGIIRISARSSIAWCVPP